LGIEWYTPNYENSRKVQGWIGLTKEQGFVKADLVENSHSNVGAKSKYIGTGGHLFAIAAKKSFEPGMDGWVCCEAKTRLINHYENELGAKVRGVRGAFIDMYLDGISTKRLCDIYSGGMV